MQNERTTLIKQTASLILQNVHKHSAYNGLCLYCFSCPFWEKQEEKRKPAPPAQMLQGHTGLLSLLSDYVCWTPKENTAKLRLNAQEDEGLNITKCAFGFLTQELNASRLGPESEFMWCIHILHKIPVFPIRWFICGGPPQYPPPAAISSHVSHTHTQVQL